MIGIAALQRKIGDYLSSEECARIENAYIYSKNAHSGQFRASGKPYIQHPLTVADILADWRFDEQSIVAALLHDVVEDTPITLPQIHDKFGATISRLVDGLSKIERIENIDRTQKQSADFDGIIQKAIPDKDSLQEKQSENFRKILLAAADDWRVLFIKLADRLHNMRTLSAFSDISRRRRIALETLLIYAPIADRLGFSPVRDELQNLSFRYLRPNRHRVLSKALNNSKAANRNVISRVETAILDALKKHEIQGDLAKRRKNLHSIYQKMQTQRLSFAQVEDIVGFRLIVDKRMDCYLALGALHECFTPTPKRFKDYIAMPKSNGYQSLHTALITKEEVQVEIQIRTRGMHIVAENGLAAHWVYKQQGTTINADTTQNEALNRLSSLVRLHAENDTPGDFMEYLQVELSPPGEIYVLTPQGTVLRLPRGSTALDFAYAIHTNVGDHAESAVINGSQLPLSRQLQSGDQVSIKTNPDILPIPHWLSIAKTARARSRIRYMLNAAGRKDLITLGRKLLINALQKISRASSIENIKEEHWRSFLGANNMQSAEELYLAMGLGKMLPDIVARGLLRKQAKLDKKTALQPVSVVGTGNSAITLSPCCYPLPFETIIGVLQKNHGLVVHSNQCPMVSAQKNRRSEKWIDTAWSDKASNIAHRSAIIIECLNKPGLATTVSSAISSQDINIITFNYSHGEVTQNFIEITAIVEVTTLAILNRLLNVLQKLPDVMEVRRRTETPKPNAP